MECHLIVWLQRIMINEIILIMIGLIKNRQLSRFIKYLNRIQKIVLRSISTRNGFQIFEINLQPAI